VTVGAGENLNVLATRYGVPASAILSANGLSSAAQVSSGRRIVIPVYSASGGGVAAQTPLPVRTAAVKAAPQTVPQTKFRLVEGPKATTPKVAEKIEPKRHIRPGQAVAKLEPPKPEKTAKVEPKPAKIEAKPVKAEPLKVAKAEVKPVQQAKAIAPVQPIAPKQEAAPAPAPAPAVVKEPEQTASLPAAASSADFRWPARGRVISGFGGNGGNEGINIALPEGSPVKASETGTVAYAGSEVKGYGNLVLIRHDNGYVSAYAHNGELNVKRGEKVKRGQVIAKSGQSGNVTSPQLHFEIRKGSTPVDPMPHLGGN
jgi:murein DD-endopeptidase MepM/ murein hydrolase activator NlpD